MYLINVKLVFICNYFLLLKSLISRVINVKVSSDYSALYIMIVIRESSLSDILSLINSLVSIHKIIDFPWKLDI